MLVLVLVLVFVLILPIHTDMYTKLAAMTLAHVGISVCQALLIVTPNTVLFPPRDSKD